jgi:hypothetical protein
MSKINDKESYRWRLNDLVDGSTRISADQRALWHLFSFYASEDENEAIYEVARETEDNLVFLSTHLIEKVKQMYIED